MTTVDELLPLSNGLENCESWRALGQHVATVTKKTLGQRLDEPERFVKFSCELDGLILDYSRNQVDSETIDLLVALAEERRLGDWIELLFSGAHVNDTEDRPALHTALRRPSAESLLVDGQDVMPLVSAELAKVADFASAVRSGKHTGHTGQAITDIVNIGIGGSDLGMVMATEALRPFADENIRTHFVSNIDGSQLADVLQSVVAEQTLFIICSKSFTTLETQLNAEAARRWFLQDADESDIARHFVAVSVNDAAMDRFGISPRLRFRIWDWVGGRYSLWSAVGLSIAIAIGPEKFRELLNGAYEMDRHFSTAPLHRNLPVLLGLIGVWNQNFLGVQSHAVLPYEQRLHRFPAFLQQLDMESNGKSVTRAGDSVGYSTGTVVWGEPGSNAQHSFFQLLHQGTAPVSLDFIAAARPSGPNTEQHQQALANMLAQAEAFARGRTADDARAELLKQGTEPADAERLAAHKAHPGNRPSNILLLRELSPQGLGRLIALYEHKVFVQSVIWGINPFDQWGVQLGKVLATRMAKMLADPAAIGELPGIAAKMLEYR